MGVTLGDGQPSNVVDNIGCRRHGGNISLQHSCSGGVRGIGEYLIDRGPDGLRRTCIRRHHNAGSSPCDLGRVRELVSSHRQADLRQTLS